MALTKNSAANLHVVNNGLLGFSLRGVPPTTGDIDIPFLTIAANITLNADLTIAADAHSSLSTPLTLSATGGLIIDGTGPVTITGAGEHTYILPDVDGGTFAMLGDIPAAYGTVEEEGTPVEQRAIMNFVGSALLAEDDRDREKTTISSHANLNGLADLGDSLGFIAKTDVSGVMAVRTLTAGDSSIIINDGDGIAANPTVAVDTSIIATRTYVDTIAQGLDPKASVRYATKPGEVINLAVGGLTQTIDGASRSLTANDRILVKDQTFPQQNGIYLAKALQWVRSSDTDTWDENIDAYCWVESGTTNKGTAWACLIEPGGTIGADPLPWTYFGGGTAVYLKLDGTNSMTGPLNMTDSATVTTTGTSFLLTKGTYTPFGWQTAIPDVNLTIKDTARGVTTGLGKKVATKAAGAGLLGIGQSALEFAVGNSQVAIGNNALRYSTGAYNIQIGLPAGTNTTSGPWQPTITGWTAAPSINPGAIDIVNRQYRIRFNFPGTGIYSELSDPIFTAGGTGIEGVQHTGIPVYSGPKTCTGKSIYRIKESDMLWYKVADLAAEDTTYLDVQPDGTYGTVEQNAPWTMLGIGYGARPMFTNEICLGGTTAGQGYTALYWNGQYMTNSLPGTDFFMGTQGGNGTDRDGGTLTIASGRSTGTGTSSLIFQTPTPAATGSLENTLEDRLTVDSDAASFDVRVNVDNIYNRNSPEALALHGGPSPLSAGAYTLVSIGDTEDNPVYWFDAAVQRDFGLIPHMYIDTSYVGGSPSISFGSPADEYGALPGIVYSAANNLIFQTGSITPNLGMIFFAESGKIRFESQLDPVIAGETAFEFAAINGMPVAGAYAFLFGCNGGNPYSIPSEGYNVFTTMDTTKSAVQISGHTGQSVPTVRIGVISGQTAPLLSSFDAADNQMSFIDTSGGMMFGTQSDIESIIGGPYEGLVLGRAKYVDDDTRFYSEANFCGINSVDGNYVNFGYFTQSMEGRNKAFFTHDNHAEWKMALAGCQVATTIASVTDLGGGDVQFDLTNPTMALHLLAAGDALTIENCTSQPLYNGETYTVVTQVSQTRVVATGNYHGAATNGDLLNTDIDQNRFNVYVSRESSSLNIVAHPMSHAYLFIGDGGVPSDDQDVFRIAVRLTDVLQIKSSGRVETQASFSSAIATGTAPYQCLSTTVNTNLNADLLDGQHGTYYAATADLGNYLPLAGGTLTGALNINMPNSNGLTELFMNPSVKTSGYYIQCKRGALPSYFTVDAFGNLVASQATFNGAVSTAVVQGPGVDATLSVTGRQQSGTLPALQLNYQTNFTGGDGVNQVGIYMQPQYYQAGSTAGGTDIWLNRNHVTPGTGTQRFLRFSVNTVDRFLMSVSGVLSITSGSNTQVDISQTGIDKASANPETFNIQNSGTGAMTLQVDGVAVALSTDLSSYLPLTGGTMLGDIEMAANYLYFGSTPPGPKPYLVDSSGDLMLGFTASASYFLFSAGGAFSAYDTSPSQIVSWTNAGDVTANSFEGAHKAADGTAGATTTVTFYAASSSGGSPTVLNTVTVKDGLITSWTQA